MSNFKSRIDKFYGISKAGSSFRIEIFAGIATFLAMAYILTTNPFMMQLGSDPLRTSALLIATALSSILATLVMSLYARLPYALAPGVGLSSMVGVVIAAGMFSYSNVMAIVLMSGILFMMVSFIPIGVNKETQRVITIREKIFDSIPATLKIAIPAGIGLFIAFIGLQNAGVIVKSDGTLIGLVDFGKDAWQLGGAAMNALICLIGLVLIAILSHFKVKGAILFGILGATIIAIPLKVADLAIIKGETVSWAFWENFGKFFSMDSNEGSLGLLFKDGFKFPAGSVMTVIVLIITFGMIDMFDTIGTVIGCSSGHPELLDGDKPKNYNKLMYTDSGSSIFGAIFGTSTVTTLVESSTGIEAGGRTGMTSLVVALLFVLSIFILPVFAFIPSAAAASALIFVGVLMMSGVGKINFLDARTAIPAFVTIICMPLAYSITDGLGLGIILYVAITAVCKLVELIKNTKNKTQTAGDTVDPNQPEVKSKSQKSELNWILVVVAVLFLVYFLFKYRP